MNDLAVAMTAVFASVALLAWWGAASLLARSSPARRRLAAAADGARGALLESPRLAAGPDPALRRLSTYVPKSPREMLRVQRRLALAGWHGTTPVVVYCVAEVVLALVGGAAVLWIFGPSFAIVAAAAAGAGYMLPGLVLQRQIALRKKQIQNGLPDALDLLIVCLEAGLGLDHALLKVADELRVPHPALSEELRMMNVETRAGRPRVEALKNFALRTQVDDVRALVAMLVQTDRFGTSVARALRTHAETSRTKRRQRAEERAAKLSVKLVFPLVFCLLPAFFVVSLGPAIIKLVEFFANNRAFSTGDLP